VPLISGKDSMKNDAVIDGVKISIPPTLLVSAMGQLEDVRAALTLVPRAIGDDVYVLGPTAAELGGSALARLHGWAPARVPQTDLTAAPVRYGAFVRARDAGLIRSAHVTGRGGLAVALAHLALACEWVVSCELTDGSLDDVSALFAESTGRIVFTARPRDRRRLRDELGPCGLVHLGVIEGRRSGLLIRRGGQTLIDCDEMQLRAAFHP
jgi:phosphoribosylformylglycinamidine synthase